MLDHHITSAFLFVLIFTTIGCDLFRNEDSHFFSFALIGDVPYPGDSLRFEYLMAEIDADPAIEWVIHVGDIKSDTRSCSDTYLEARQAWLDRFEDPFILTPGDNEWTDCHTVASGGYAPLERLAAFRQIFYPVPGQTMGAHSMAVTSQALETPFTEFPENVMWEREGVVFATLHVVGSRNGLMDFSGRTEADDAEAQLRMEAAVAWLERAFDYARTTESRGIFLAIHANPGFEAYAIGAADVAYLPLLSALDREMGQYMNPVVLAHGDSHYFRIDKPLISATTRRRWIHFTRVEVFGGGDVHWLRVTVDPSDENVFSIRQEIVAPDLGGNER